MDVTRKYRVLIVDAEPVSRYGLVHLLNSHEHLKVVAETEELPGARSLCARHQPQLILLDVALGDGIEFIRELKRLSPQGHVVVFTSRSDVDSITRAFRAGATAYVTRRDPVIALVNAVLGAIEGQKVFSPCVQKVLLDQFACGSMELRGRAETTLSDRELQIYTFLGQGMKARAVAAELRLSVKTVETHLHRIKLKLGVATGGELQRRAVLYQNAR